MIYQSSDVVGNLPKLREGDVYRDELQSLITQLKNNPSDKIVVNLEEGTLDYEDTAGLDDYGIMNIQLNHDWKIGTPIYPHIHWIQERAGNVNWIYQYRWLINGQEQSTDWTYHVCQEPVFEYTSGRIGQINRNGGIEPPANVRLSSILQVRVIRDVVNASGECTGPDTYTGLAKAVNFDIHMIVDAKGSVEQYRKF